MKVGDRELLIHNILCNELVPILRAKAHDYSGEDVHSNFKDFGWQGVIVRIGDKYHRLKNFVLQDNLAVKDETIEDTLKDIINYGFIALILYRSSIDSQAIPGICEE